MRIALLDILRGLSLIGMIAVHIWYMLGALWGYELGILSPSGWDWLGFIVASTFILVSGYSNTLGYSEKSVREIYPKALKRAGILTLVAFGISFVTYTFVPEVRISWGIIHFFALVALVHPLFTRLGIISSFFFGFVSLILGLILSTLTLNTMLLIPLGVMSYDYFSADYYPLFPWFSLVLWGQTLAKFSLKYGFIESLQKLRFPYLAPFAWLGRHSLIIYALHAPILYWIFSLVFIYFS